MRLCIDDGAFVDALFVKGGIPWWELYGGECTLLQDVAYRVLCIPASSCAGERVFSALKNIWTDKRASMLMGKAAMLAFVYFNKRVIERIDSDEHIIDEDVWLQFIDYMDDKPVYDLVSEEMESGDQELIDEAAKDLKKKGIKRKEGPKGKRGGKRQRGEIDEDDDESASDDDEEEGDGAGPSTRQLPLKTTKKKATPTRQSPRLLPPAVVAPPPAVVAPPIDPKVLLVMRIALAMQQKQQQAKKTQVDPKP